MAKEEILEPTGILGLDYTLGGLPRGGLLVVMGDPGSGIEVFARQIAVLRAKGGCKIIYMNVDSPLEDVKREMGLYGWDVNVLEREGLWSFIDAYGRRRSLGDTTAKRGMVRESFNEAVKELLDKLRDNVDSCSVIDTLSYFLLTLGVSEVLKFMEDLKYYARQGKGLHLLLVVKGLHSERTLAALTHFSDGLLDFDLNLDNPEAPGTIRVRKLKGLRYKVKPIPYRITEEGLTIETAVRIY